MQTINKVVVVGAGAAGLACAISAARQGAAVTLVEKTKHLGGTVAHSLIHTIGGLYDDEGNFINEGLSLELVDLLFQADTQTHKRKMGKVWVLNVDPAVYETVVEKWIASQSNITVLRQTLLQQIKVSEDWIEGIQVTKKKQTLDLDLEALIDTTGTAEVVRLVDPNKVVDGEALSGLVFQIRGVVPNALKFPKNVGIQRNVQKAIDRGDLPATFAKTWFDTGVYEDEVYAKLSLLTTAYQAEAVSNLQAQLAQYLRLIPDFAKAEVTRVGQLGVRDGGRIKGTYCLTLEDVKSGRTFTDSVGRCAWPIEYWDPDRGVTLDYLPPHHFYEIPLRSLQVSGFKNLWAAGKCISAKKLAQASARVAGTCWAMGDALGKVVARRI